ncbi:MAG: phosphosulfolactate synthase [Flavobacteriales bacterium]|nr:phosphosulfolactate synthase [Flavobacteriales bacterium]
MNFTLNHLPERTSHPRDNGVTMVMDKGLSVRQAENFLENCGELVDIVKLGFGTSYFAKNLKQKIEIYRNSNIKTYVGGTLFEAFYVRNQLDDFKRFVDDFGMDTVEISDGSVTMPHDEKCEMIHDFSKNYRVLSEVGSKEEGILISPAKWIRMMSNELEAGSWKVIAEARESGTVGIYRPNGTAHVVLINKILSKVKLEDILWEAPIKSQQVWFIKQFGANVNLGNIPVTEVIPLECLRLGLRGDTFKTFLPDSLLEL